MLSATMIEVLLIKSLLDINKNEKKDLLLEKFENESALA